MLLTLPKYLELTTFSIIDDPEKDENIDGDPFNTLFVTHLSSELTESDLAREFELYGQIKKIRLVHDKEGKSLCYAFIEFEREKDMRGSYSSLSTILKERPLY